MKREEKIAEDYFKSLGYENIIFEPKGNRTPDFSIGDNIAIEVRRLNQFNNGKPIEKVSHSLLPKFINQIESFGNKKHAKSAFVGIRYSRPINYNKIIKEKIKAILEFHSSIMESKGEYHINDNLNLSIIPSTEKLDSQFHFGISVDFDQGGFVLGNIYNSLKLIIPEKINKIEKYKSEYQTWWLALIDYVGNGLSETELIQLRESIDFDLKFDKGFIISYLEPIRGGEI